MDSSHLCFLIFNPISIYGVILRQLEREDSKLFLWYFKWVTILYNKTDYPLYENFLFRNINGSIHPRPAILVTKAIQTWCGEHYKTTVQDLRYSVETYATKLLKNGQITENDKMLISEGTIA